MHKKFFQSFSFRRRATSDEHRERRQEKMFLCNHFNEFNFFVSRIGVSTLACVLISGCRDIRINVCLCHQHNSSMLWKMCRALFFRERASVMKIFIDIINYGVWNKMENFPPAHTHTHTRDNQPDSHTQTDALPFIFSTYWFYCSY